MKRRPPSPAVRLLELLLPPGQRDEVLGDLEEEFRRRPRGIATDLWYWGQALVTGIGMSAPRLVGFRGTRSPGGHGGRRGGLPARPRGMTGVARGLGEASRELRLTLRGLVRRPGYTVLAVATILLGVGAVTAAYGLLHEAVLRPLPFEDVDRLVTVRTLYDGEPLGMTGTEHRAVADGARTLEGVAALVLPGLDREWTWEAGEGRRPLAAVRVTDGFFRTLGVTPVLGTLGGEDGGGRRALVTRGFWRRELGGDPSAVGRVLRINGEPYRVAGVLPASFEFPLGLEPREVWIPFVPEVVDPYPGMPLSHQVVARMAPGVDRETVAAEVRQIVEGLRAGVSDTPGETVVRSLREDLVASARRPLVLLTLAGGLVLLVASLNLSMLVAARNVDRREELRVRTALGATRGRILRHLLSEAAVLALLGGGLAVVLAGWALERVSGRSTVGLERLGHGGAGPEVVAVGLVAALLPALLAASVPALRAARGLGGLGSRGASRDRAGQRFAWIVSGIESGAVFALLVVATLVIRSFHEVTSVDPGFDTSSTVALDVFLPAEGPGPAGGEASATLLRQLEEGLGRLPEVRGVGTISNLPLSHDGWSGGLRIEGREAIGEGREVVVDWELVSPGYFGAMGIPILEGRVFDERDRAGSHRTVVINETLARRWWGEGEAIGARISGGGPPGTVVGVVGDVKVRGLHTETRGSMYLPALQLGVPPRQEVVVRVAGDDPTAAVAELRRRILELEPSLAVGSVRALDTLVSQASGPFRLRAVLLGTFSTLALLLGMAGIYGVTAHGVRSRRRDMGIRMAVGADGRRILSGVLGRALIPVGVGLVGGLGAVLLAAPALRAFLFGVSPTDIAALAGIAALLLTSASAAVLPSALRARGIDPASLLRDE